MARIDMVATAVAVGVGVVDEVLEAADEKGARTNPFQKWADYGRLIGAGGGYLMQIFDFNPKLGADLAQSCTPLLVKSISAPIRSAIKESAGSAGSVVRRARATRVQESIVISPAIGREEIEVGVIRP